MGKLACAALAVIVLSGATWFLISHVLKESPQNLAHLSDEEVLALWIENHSGKVVEQEIDGRYPGGSKRLEMASLTSPIPGGGRPIDISVMRAVNVHPSRFLYLDRNRTDLSAIEFHRKAVGASP